MGGVVSDADLPATDLPATDLPAVGAPAPDAWAETSVLLSSVSGYQVQGGSCAAGHGSSLGWTQPTRRALRADGS
ncbi:MAG: hypothetical protein ACI80K_001777, partial [Paracoccaceae bacterium]